MKLTIAPSEDQSAEIHPYFAVTIEHPNDDTATATQLVEMFYMALLAMGHNEANAIKAIQGFAL